MCPLHHTSHLAYNIELITTTRVKNIKLALPILFFYAIAVILISDAVFFRIWHLANIPGLNGDETFFGINAISLLRNGKYVWTTPNGNFVDPFIQLPAIILAAILPPSAALLRTPSVIFGLLAIAAAFQTGRKIFSNEIGAAFALLIAAIPECIAQSRFAWEPSQSVFFDILSLICSLSIVKDFEKSAKWIAWNVIAIICAVFCHPTNIFISVFFFVALILRFQTISILLNLKKSGFKAVLIYLVFFGLLSAAVYSRTHVSDIGNIRVHLDTNGTLAFFLFFSRLFSGITCFRYLSGSWLLGTVEPSAIVTVDILGLILIFGSLTFGCVQAFMKNSKLDTKDQLLFAGTVLLILFFFLLAGAGGLDVGNERYGLVLIAPVLLSFSRVIEIISSYSNISRILAFAGVLGLSSAWLVMFFNGYFKHIEQTGGTASHSAQTGPIEPKLAAWKEIQAEDTHKGQEGLVLTTTWWNSSPLNYYSLELADNKLAVHKINPAIDPTTQQIVQSASQAGRLWFVEFYGSGASQLLKTRLDSAHYDYTEKIITGYGNTPIDDVIHVIGTHMAPSVNNKS